MAVHYADVEVGLAGTYLRVRSAAEQCHCILLRLCDHTSYVAAQRSFDIEASASECISSRLLITQVAGILRDFEISRIVLVLIVVVVVVVVV